MTSSARSITRPWWVLIVVGVAGLGAALVWLLAGSGAPQVPGAVPPGDEPPPAEVLDVVAALGSGDEAAVRSRMSVELLQAIEQTGQQALGIVPAGSRLELDEDSWSRFRAAGQAVVVVITPDGRRATYDAVFVRQPDGWKLSSTSEPR